MRGVMHRVARPVFALLLALGALGADAAGREAYDDFYCETCHGAQGIGSYGVQAPKLAGMEPWYLQRQLEKFRSGLRGTHAGDETGVEMRAMAVKLSDGSIEQLLQWIAGWPEIDAPSTVAGDAKSGAALYASCAACHGPAGGGNRALGAPALAGQSDWYLLTQLKNFSRGYRGQHPDDSEGATMRAAVSALPDEQAMRDVVAYIAQLEGPANSSARLND